MAPFCIDTNVLIEAKNGPYAFDIVPGFWEWLDKMMSSGRIYSTETVYDELTEGNDELAQWVRERRNNGYFVLHSEDVQKKYSQIADYISSTYESHHAASFLSGADPWVIAQALVANSTVVTREATVSPYSKKVKIPNVCNQFGVRCIDTFTMLREAGARFR